MGLSILIVDDTKFLRLMLGDILRKAGHEVIAEAENGEIGVQQYRKYKPDLVVLDLTMPVMDGITTLREIRKIQPDAMIIICSAMSQRDLISEAIDAGANGYIMKPFEPDRVKQAINQIMDRIIRTEPEIMEEIIEVEIDVEVEAGPAILEQHIDNSRNEEVEQITDLQFNLNPFQEVDIDFSQLQQSLNVDNEAISLHHDLESELELVMGDLINTEEVEVIDDILLYGALDEAEAEVAVEVEAEVEEVNVDVEMVETVEVEMIVEMEDEEEDEVEMEAAVDERMESQPEFGVVQFRKNINRFNSSIMCNWEENVDNNDTNYFVIHSEVNETLRIEMMNENQQKQSITFSVDGFSYLVDWLADKGVITRNNIA